MGARGPAPTPTQILKLRGSWRGSARKDEPKAPKTPPAEARWLDREGKAEWARVTETLKGMDLLSSADRAILVGMCQNWSLFVRVSKQLNRAKGPAALLELRGLISVAAEAYRNYSHGCQQFGLSPASRSRVQTRQDPEAQTPAAKHFG
jgi:P27 family predicted phage terminase small subunit